MQHKKILFFGSIGVLAETSDIQRQAYNQALDEAGLHWSWDAETYRALLEMSGGRDRLRMLSEATGAGLTDEAIERIHARKTEIACARIRRERTPLRPGVAALIGRAWAEGLRLGLVTTTYQENIDAIADAAGAHLPLDQFDVVVSRERVSVGKPDPAAYRLALKETDQTSERAIAVEDTMASVLSATGAGIETIATPGAFARGQSFFMAHYTVDALADEGGALHDAVCAAIFG